MIKIIERWKIWLALSGLFIIPGLIALFAWSLNFGIDLINTIRVENPHLWNEAFQQEAITMIREAVELEIAYAYDTMPRGVLGMNADMFVDYLRYIANRRCVQFGLPEQYPGAKNTFPWMSEIIDLKKEKNFFETRVTEYQTGGALEWD